MSASPLSAADVPFNIYRAHLDQGRLAYQYSPDAGRAVFPPRLLCPYTGSDRLEWNVSAGLGTVYSLTRIASRDLAPYWVVLVDMDEGFRMMSRLLPAAGGEPGIGDRVRVRMGRLGDVGDILPLFEPEEMRHA